MSKREGDTSSEESGSKKAKSLVLKELWSHQRSAIAWMMRREMPSDRSLPSGGILGDEMGLGKTASILGLIFWQYLKNPRLQTLIVVPASLLYKWRDEWHKHFDVDVHSVLIYHGENRARCVGWSRKRQRWFFDPRACVILTTYGQVLSDYKASMGSPDKTALSGCLSEAGYQYGILGATAWNRIVLDESHLSIQNVKAKRFAALSWLQALRRWAVTGTVHTNSWTDVAAICQWINVPPYCDYEWWKTNWTLAEPIRIWRFGQKSTFRNEAHIQGFQRTDLGKETLSYILIRTKELIKNLPSIRVDNLKLDLSRGELLAYDTLARQFKAMLARYIHSRKARTPHPTEPGAVTITAPAENRAELFRIICKYLTQIRQFCNHPRLAKGAASTDQFRLDRRQNTLCSECSEQENLTAGGCGHLLCKECCKRLGPNCSGCLNANAQLSDQQPLRITSRPIYTGSPDIQCMHCGAPGHVDWRSSECALRTPLGDQHNYGLVGHSTKVEVILKTLEAWKRSDVKEKYEQPFKVIIFSQWVSSFNLLEPILQANGYGSLRFTGEITNLEERGQLLRRFATDPSIPILLCGLKVGGVGLDLVMANRVILLEPWYNLPVEDQAKDRLHRMGQTRPVHVIKLSIHWSVEDWMYGLQERKHAESRWLRGEWAGNKSSNSQFTAKDLDSLNCFLCPSYYLDHHLARIKS